MTGPRGGRAPPGKRNRRPGQEAANLEENTGNGNETTNNPAASKIQARRSRPSPAQIRAAAFLAPPGPR
jgi:hypothetical protein